VRRAGKDKTVMVALPELPEIGQLVIVRNRQFVVAQILPGEPIPDASITTRPPQRLITLESVEDDALGEELQVIWELELGARVVQQNNLPPPIGFDPPERFDAFMNAVRWGVVSAEDTTILQSPFRSGVELKEYQLDPLVRSLSMPRVNLLIADDVGLGKTIETGMVMQEMLIRGRARTVLIVCPAGLQLHWRDQMRDKFGLEFRIIDSDAMRWLRRSRGIHINPWAHFPRLITSIDFLKRDRAMRLLRELLPKEGEMQYPRPFDLLVVDEAHNIAPASGAKARKYAVESQRTQAVRALAPHFEHKLFLSATPHNGYKESFTALLELLDNQRFARGIEPNKEQLKRVMVRRMKSELKDNGVPVFKERILIPLEAPYTAVEKTIHHKLKAYADSRRQSVADAGERTATEFVLKLLKKRLFSSPAAFYDTLQKHQQTLAGKPGDEKRTRRIKSGILRGKIQAMEEDVDDDEALEEELSNAAVTASAQMADLTPAERALLQEMTAWAAAATYSGDSKLATLLAWLGDIVKPDGKWNDERVILFTEYRATQKWLYERLIAAGFNRLKVIYGGMDEKEREAIKAEFQADPAVSDVRILLATDAASEGIDLQNYCHRLLHIEIPWNPNRLEQRNGRIDRHGQQFHPEIFHFVPQGFAERYRKGTTLEKAGELEADLEFLMRAVYKVDQIREDLGSVGPVIAEQVEAAMLGARRSLDTARAEEQAQKARRLLRYEKELQKEIDKYHLRVLETREALALEPENVARMVQTALALAGQSPLRPNGEPGVFDLPYLTGSWGVCARGLPHPHTKKKRPITFDPQRAYRRDDVVYVHLNHPLAQQSIRLLRAEVGKPDPASAALYRVTAREAPKHHLPEGKPAVLAFARLVITGGDNQRLHEELIVAGGSLTLDAARPFSRITTLRALDDIVGHMRERPLSAAHQVVYQELWPKIQGPLFDSLNKRAAERMSSYEQTLLERAEKQADEIEAILRELARAIERELDESEPVQLQFDFSGWTEAERQQLTRDTAALRRRLETIPAEIAAEKERIINRVLSPTPRLFPIAVVFLKPGA
jgi:SNF2 family DNA or RNA helicase